MSKKELIEMSRKYVIASGTAAQKLSDGSCKIILKPAMSNVDNDLIGEILSHRDDEGLHARVYNHAGIILDTIVSEYAKGNVIYVRESYFLDDGKVNYCAEDSAKFAFSKKKVISGRYMKKNYARTFLTVDHVKLVRLHDLTCSDLHDSGYGSFENLFFKYDSELSEKQYEYCSASKNPYVFVYYVSKIDY